MCQPPSQRPSQSQLHLLPTVNARLQPAHQPQRLRRKKASSVGSKACSAARLHLPARSRNQEKTSAAKAVATSAVNAPSAVAVTAAVVAAVSAVPAANVVASVAQNAVKRVNPASRVNPAANAVPRPALSAHRAKAAPKVAVKSSHAVKAKVAVSVHVVSAATAAQSATARHVMLRRKNSHWPTRPPWPLHLATTPPTRMPRVKSASPVKHVVKVAANAVGVAMIAVTAHPAQKTTMPPLRMVALRKPLNDSKAKAAPQSRATGKPPVKTAARNAHRVNAAAVTATAVTAASAVTALMPMPIQQPPQPKATTSSACR